MPKQHAIVLRIQNNTGVTLTFKSDWFDSGRLGDGESWPSTIEDGDTSVIQMYERDWALAGCSGLCTYTVDGGEITIAFSNPAAGSNKLGVGTGGTDVWDSMDSHDYNTFQEDFNVNGAAYHATC